VDAVSEEDGQVFLDLGLPPSRLYVSGDPRFDRVLSRIQERLPHALMDVPPFEQCLLAGSTWPVEENLILDAYAAISREFPSSRLFLVPHEPTESALQRLEEAARERGFPVSRLSRSTGLEAGALLLGDVKGQLSELYSQAEIAYVGGGFTSGVHSVLEAAAQGIPLLFGPGIDRAVEARGLLEAGAAYMVCSGEDLKSHWRELLGNRPLRNSMGNRARRFTEAGSGASQRSLEHLYHRLNLPDKSREKV
jgi:3-deoxy-D-manno-octulosonic-acid transferase